LKSFKKNKETRNTKKHHSFVDNMHAITQCVSVVYCFCF